VFIGGGRGAVDGDAVALAASVIVPTGHRRLNQRKRRSRLAQRLLNYIIVRANMSVEFRIEYLDFAVDVRHVLEHLMWLKLDCAIQPELPRVRVAESLCHNNDRVFVCELSEQSSPTSNGGSGIRNQSRSINH